MEKKQYQAPTVQVVRLDVKTAVLGSCNSSTELLAAPCTVPGNCRIPVSPNESFNGM